MHFPFFLKSEKSTHNTVLCDTPKAMRGSFRKFAYFFNQAKNLLPGTKNVIFSRKDSLNSITGKEYNADQ